MFKLELLDLLKRYPSAEEYEQKKILHSLNKLISEHQEEFQFFISEANLSEGQQGIIDKAQESPLETPEQNSDFEKIKKYYSEWNTEFLRNGRVPSERCEQIVVELIKFYAPNRFEVLQHVIDIEDDQDYEAFKNMLMNYLKAYYYQMLGDFLKSSRFDQLDEKEQDKRLDETEKIFNQLDRYQYPISKIREVMS